MCLCLLLIVIDREKGMPFITSFPEFVISFSSVHPSLYLRSSFVHPIVAGTDLQRIYNGTTTDLLMSGKMLSLFFNNEVYRFLLYDYLHRVGRCVDIRERMAVDTDRCVFGDFYRDIVASVWKNHLVVQNLST